jgi:hypothetical protein
MDLQRVVDALHVLNEFEAFVSGKLRTKGYDDAAVSIGLDARYRSSGPVWMGIHPHGRRAADDERSYFAKPGELLARLQWLVGYADDMPFRQLWSDELVARTLGIHRGETDGKIAVR